MTVRRAAALVLLVCILSFRSSPEWLVKAEQKPAVADMALVEITGLKLSYTSCALVHFSVHNISEQEFDAEIYVENFESGSWEDDTYPYDIHAPVSLYEKRVLTNADKMKPGQSWDLGYNRCLQPRFVKEGRRAFRNAIIEKDASAKTEVLQRIRVDMYSREKGQLVLIQRTWSNSFKRTAAKSS